MQFTQKIILTNIEPDINANSEEQAVVLIQRLGLMPRKKGSTERMHKVLIELYERAKDAARHKNPTKSIMTVEDMAYFAGITRQTMYDYLQVVTTVSTKDDAERLAVLLLEQRLAGCVQIAPCISMYHWQGNIEKDEELRLIIKTKAAHYTQLEKLLQNEHPYEVPEILAFAIERGSTTYLQWLEKELSE